MKTKHKMKTHTKATEETTLVAFLLDRSGSMQCIKQETIGGFNGYLDEMLKKPESRNIRFNFTQFDTVGIDQLCDCVPLKDVAKLNDSTFEPRGGTPLYDAIGRTIRYIEGKAATLKAKVLFVTLTDGQENSSSEWSQATIKTLIKEKEVNDKWTFSYVGIGPDAWMANQALAAGTIGASNVLNMTSANAQQSYSGLAHATTSRCCTIGGQSMGHMYAGVDVGQQQDQTTTAINKPATKK